MGKGLGYFNGVLVWLLFVVILIGVVTRVVGAPAIWTFPVAGALMSWVGFIGFAQTHDDDAEVRVDLLVKSLREQLARWIRVATDAISAIFCLVMAIAGVTLTQTSYINHTLTEDLFAIPVWLLQLPVFIGFGALFLYFVRDFLRGVRPR